MMVALACVLTGAVLGLRFRVHMLVVAFALAIVVIGLPSLAAHGPLTAMWQVGVGLLLLQAGYLAGVVTCFVIVAARRAETSSASLQPSSPQ